MGLALCADAGVVAAPSPERRSPMRQASFGQPRHDCRSPESVCTLVRKMTKPREKIVMAVKARKPRGARCCGVKQGEG